ncbi:MAG: serine hydrolase [Patescibacteria group bacterium]|nr:serine hydrolase [Patescibacteria group bacterium]MDD4443930.1 serine hydrolase [Patescibacteria group bacterium]NCU39539.1 D-alanyl-D-alanine carboxypeptidase [Candidatus Falkowbacteria bacterium]
MIISVFVNLILLIASLIFNINYTVLQSGLSYNIVPSELNEEISAQKAVVLGEDGRLLLYSKNANDVQPIASITKLMTALVFLESNPQWDDIYTITPNDQVTGGKVHLFNGDKLKIKDLFLTSLVASDNGATLALVHATPFSEEEFVARMNTKAKELRLENTFFADPIGLSEKNVATARESALLVLAAFKEEAIREAISLKTHQFETLQGKLKKIESTDYLLFDDEENIFSPLGGKTGYTEKAGYCFAGIFAGEEGDILAAAVLNSAGKNGRFQESKEIIRWTLDNYFNNSK